jgi:hypothetical protein
LTLQQARLYVACLFLLGYAGAAPRQSRDSKSAQPPPRFRFGFHWHDQASVSAAAASPSKIFASRTAFIGKTEKGAPNKDAPFSNRL